MSPVFVFPTFLRGFERRSGQNDYDDAFVNAEIVRRGYAYSKAYPPDIKYQIFLEAMEKEARMASRGIWE